MTGIFLESQCLRAALEGRKYEYVLQINVNQMTSGDEDDRCSPVGNMRLIYVYYEKVYFQGTYLVIHRSTLMTGRIPSSTRIQSWTQTQCYKLSCNPGLSCLLSLLCLVSLNGDSCKFTV